MPAKPPLIVRLADLLGERLPAFLAKHPSLTAAGAGMGLGALSMRGPVHQMEGQLTMERMGHPQAKYSSATLADFSKKKTILATKLAFTKYADFGEDISGGFSGGVGKGIAAEGIGAIRRLIGMTAQAIKEKTINEPQRQTIVQNIIEQDPIVSGYEQQQPGMSAQAFQTMRRFAPELSTDPNIVQAFLRNAAMTGGVMDYATIKGLADAEAAVHKAQNEGQWLKGGF